MNPTETDILAFWREHTDSHGFPPARRAAAAYFDVSRGTIDGLVRSLHCRGLMQAGGVDHQGDAISARGRSFLADATVEPIPYLPAAPRVTICIGEARCACGASHFRIGEVQCFDCAQKASA